jgi:hypothetical protein
MRRLHAIAIASVLFAASPALAGEPLVLHVDAGSDVAEDEVRRAIAAELGETLGTEGTGARRIDVRSTGGVVRVTFRDARGRTLEREVTAPADGAARVRLIALLAGNLARNEADDLVKRPADDRTELILRVAPGETARAEVSPAAAPPAVVPPPAPPPSDGSTQRTIGWIGVVAGAVTAAGGALLALSASSDNSTLENQCVPSCLASDLDAARRKALIGDVMMGAGALVGIGGAVLVLTAPSDTPKPAEPPSDGATQRTLGWIGIGSGVALAGAGVVLRVLAGADRSDAEKQCVNRACAASAFATLSRAEGRETASNWAFGGALVLAATGTILELTAPSAKNTSVAVGPSGVRVAQAF